MNRKVKWVELRDRVSYFKWTVYVFVCQGTELHLCLHSTYSIKQSSDQRSRYSYYHEASFDIIFCLLAMLCLPVHVWCCHVIIFTTIHHIVTLSHKNYPHSIQRNEKPGIKQNVSKESLGKMLYEVQAMRSMPMYLCLP